jgi:hypothetical protein
MRVLDSHPSVKTWASEAIQIPYQDPTTGRWRMYIPDFFITYIDSEGKTHGEVIEVKPIKQTLESAARSRRDKAAVKLNTAKWESAVAWCKTVGLTFRIMTEKEIYRNPRR